jgi:hypothetical protein
VPPPLPWLFSHAAYRNAMAVESRGSGSRRLLMGGGGEQKATSQVGHDGGG